MIRIGITGNIGTGKTTVCKIFESLGVPVYYADSAAKKFYLDPKVIQDVKQLFGNDIFDSNGNLRSAELAHIVFHDAVLLRQLNAIIHPLVLEDFKKWADQHADHKYIIYESALLFESGFHMHFDQSILVTAPEKLARARVMSRDQVTAEEFNSRRAMQMPENEKINLSNYLIANDEKEALIPRIIELHSLFKEMTD